jgi:hypothetical protein
MNSPSYKMAFKYCKNPSGDSFNIEKNIFSLLSYIDCLLELEKVSRISFSPK